MDQSIVHLRSVRCPLRDTYHEGAVTVSVCHVCCAIQFSYTFCRGLIQRLRLEDDWFRSLCKITPRGAYPCTRGICRNTRRHIGRELGSEDEDLVLFAMRCPMTDAATRVIPFLTFFFENYHFLKVFPKFLRS